MKDSGERQSFSSGMVRDTAEGKVNFLNVRFGPMMRRWAEHLTKGRLKYPDVEPGVPNWTLASGAAEYLRAKESAERHFDAWLRGERDEDHAAGVYFNINLAEYVLEKDPSIDPGLGATVSPAVDDGRPAQVALEGFVHTGEYREPKSGEWFQARGFKSAAKHNGTPGGGLHPGAPRERWILIEERRD